MSFDHRKACRRLAEFSRVRFNHHKTCKRLAEFRGVGSDRHKASIVGLQKFGECIMTTANRLRRGCVEWGSTNTTGTSMFKFSHIKCETKNIMGDRDKAFMA